MTINNVNLIDQLISEEGFFVRDCSPPEEMLYAHSVRIVWGSETVMLDLSIPPWRSFSYTH